MINAGAILICALLKTLVKPDMTLAEKFDFTMNYFEVSSKAMTILAQFDVKSLRAALLFTFLEVSGR